MASGRGRVLQRFVLLAIGAAVLTCFIGTATASALETRLLQKSFKPTAGFQNAGPQGVAVDQNTETVYVADAGAGTVFLFEADGTPAPKPQLTKADGTTVYPFGTPTGVAVDNSGGSAEGYVYVADLTAKDVRQFDASGSATAFDPITVADLPKDGTAQAGGLLPVANSGSWAPNGVAVAPTGDIYVADPANGVVDVFSSSGTFLRQLGSGQLPSAAWVAIRIHRLLWQSATTPAWSIRNSIGSEPTTPTAPTASAEVVSVSTTRDWATCCIQVPVIETIWLSQYRRKVLFCNTGGRFRALTPIRRGKIWDTTVDTPVKYTRK